jgi:hypothetical protein
LYAKIPCFFLQASREGGGRSRTLSTPVCCSTVCCLAV